MLMQWISVIVIQCKTLDITLVYDTCVSTCTIFITA